MSEQGLKRLICRCMRERSSEQLLRRCAKEGAGVSFPCTAHASSSLPATRAAYGPQSYAARSCFGRRPRRGSARRRAGFRPKWQECCDKTFATPGVWASTKGTHRTRAGTSATPRATIPGPTPADFIFSFRESAATESSRGSPPIACATYSTHGTRCATPRGWRGIPTSAGLPLCRGAGAGSRTRRWRCQQRTGVLTSPETTRKPANPRARAGLNVDRHVSIPAGVHGIVAAKRALEAVEEGREPGKGMAESASPYAVRRRGGVQTLLRSCQCGPDLLKKRGTTGPRSTRWVTRCGSLCRRTSPGA